MIDKIIIFIKKYWKITSYVIGGLIIMYWMIYLFTPKPNIPSNYINTIDSLTKENNNIKKQQDSLINTVKINLEKVAELQYKINNIKERIIITREYYHNTQQQVDKYNNSQLDSFFKKRYNY
jgi:peptidoglycan hydrolase CwlO-like protein